MIYNNSSQFDGSVLNRTKLGRPYMRECTVVVGNIEPGHPSLSSQCIYQQCRIIVHQMYNSISRTKISKHSIIALLLITILRKSISYTLVCVFYYYFLLNSFRFSNISFQGILRSLYRCSFLNLSFFSQIHFY